MAQVPPGQTPMLDHSFTLQAIMELQRTLAELGAKTERLIKDVESQNGKLDAVRHQVTYAKGALVILAAILGIGITVATAYVRNITPSQAAMQQAAPAK